MCKKLKKQQLNPIAPEIDEVTELLGVENTGEAIKMVARSEVAIGGVISRSCPRIGLVLKTRQAWRWRTLGTWQTNRVSSITQWPETFGFGKDPPPPKPLDSKDYPHLVAKYEWKYPLVARQGWPWRIPARAPLQPKPPDFLPLDPPEAPPPEPPDSSSLKPSALPLPELLIEPPWVRNKERLLAIVMEKETCEELDLMG